MSTGKYFNVKSRTQDVGKFWMAVSTSQRRIAEEFVDTLKGIYGAAQEFEVVDTDILEPWKQHLCVAPDL